MLLSYKPKNNNGKYLKKSSSHSKKVDSATNVDLSSIRIKSVRNKSTNSHYVSTARRKAT